MTEERVKFFNRIVQTTVSRDHPNFLRQATSELLEKVLDHWETNVEAAASFGHSSAYIFVYTDAASHYDVPVKFLMCPDERILLKYKEYNIPTIMDQVKEKIKPFHAIHIDINGNVHAIQISWPSNKDALVENAQAETKAE